MAGEEHRVGEDAVHPSPELVGSPERALDGLLHSISVSDQPLGREVPPLGIDDDDEHAVRSYEHSIDPVAADDDVLDRDPVGGRLDEIVARCAGDDVQGRPIDGRRRCGTLTWSAQSGSHGPSIGSDDGDLEDRSGQRIARLTGLEPR
ncbi:MAG: hypothetical protein GWO04_35835 [Actinobacteria bacterium]|nr:hypothetical protein [Actinomycetota bacterium]